VVGDAAVLTSHDPEHLAGALRGVLAGAAPDARRGANVAGRYDGEALGERVIDVYRSLLSSAPERVLVAAN
ncbi:MAG: hypothetical protein IAI50_05440, partial [Candidatus Eremiobacteraeota bacterium]|nr:hypothetical protein [Candidatus Eremiobacteraeota bacterium]